MYIKDCHETAMSAADRFLPLTKGSHYDRQDMLIAALYETEAACTAYLTKQDDNILDSCILLRSAATCALHADFPAMALVLVTTALALNPSGIIEDELKEVQQKALTRLQRFIHSADFFETGQGD